MCAKPCFCPADMVEYFEDYLQTCKICGKEAVFVRRILAILAAAVLLVCLLTCTVSAESRANSVSVFATVSSDGSCQVTVTALLHLEQAVGQLYFPLPLNAESVTLNGARVRTTRTATARQVDLSGIAGNLVGEFSITMTYILRDLVSYNEDEILQLQLPLLSGFDYPVEQFAYSVTLPGTVGNQPSFSSGYHQANIEKDLTSQVAGPVISGASNKALKDHETLSMTLTVNEELFPQNRIELPDFNVTNTLMWIILALAALYWLIFLRCGFPWVRATAATPEGFSAGQLGSVLHMQGADLTMMVLTWAQLGYLHISKGKNGRVLLRKRMDMGNERSGFEQRCFSNLFGRRDTVDTSELRYVEQWEKASKMNPNIQELIHPRSGSKKIFRLLAALIGLFGGAGVGIAIGAGAAARWLWVAVFALMGFLFAWHIQRWAEGLLQRNKKPLWVSLVLCVIWLALSILAGVFSIGFWTVVSQLLAGLFGAFGGRRTDAGKQAYAQVLGLRKYLRKVSREDLQRISQNNPDYFYDMAPYAVALGVDKHFAKRFGKAQLPDCPYIDAGTEVQLTAFGWSERIRRMTQVMDLRRKQLWRERILGAVRSFRK